MAERKTIKREIEVEMLETGRYLIRDGTPENVVRATLHAAAELQAAGVRLDSMSNADIEIVMGYDPTYMGDDFGLRVPVVGESQEGTAPEPEADGIPLSNLSLEQLYRLQSRVDKHVALAHRSAS